MSMDNPYDWDLAPTLVEWFSWYERQGTMSDEDHISLRARKTREKEIEMFERGKAQGIAEAGIAQARADIEELAAVVRAEVLAEVKAALVAEWPFAFTMDATISLERIAEKFGFDLERDVRRSRHRDG